VDDCVEIVELVVISVVDVEDPESWEGRDELVDVSGTEGLVTESGIVLVVSLAVAVDEEAKGEKSLETRKPATKTPNKTMATIFFCFEVSGFNFSN